MRYLLALLVPPLAVLACGRLIAFIINVGLFGVMLHYFGPVAAFFSAVVHALFVVDRHMSKKRLARALTPVRRTSSGQNRFQIPEAKGAVLAVLNKQISKETLESLRSQIRGAALKKALSSLIYAWRGVYESKSLKSSAASWSRAEDTLVSAYLDHHLNDDVYEQIHAFLKTWCFEFGDKNFIEQSTHASKALKGRKLGFEEALDFKPFVQLLDFVDGLPSFNDGGRWAARKRFELRVWVNQLRWMSSQDAANDQWAQRALKESGLA